MNNVAQLIGATRLEADTLRERVAELEAQLAECYRLSGADPDDNEDWRIAGDAVKEVARMRQEYDAMESELVKYHADAIPFPFRKEAA